MKVDIQIDPQLTGRTDLLAIVQAAADFLATRDHEQRATAEFRLWSGPQGQHFVTLAMRDADYARASTFTVQQIAPQDAREYRLLDAWDGVLKYRLDTQMRRTNELIAQMED
jgi:hypothetical protein